MIDPAFENLLRSVVALIGFLLFLVAYRSRWRESKRVVDILHVAAAVLGVLCFYNFGFLQHYNENDGFVNHAEQFHYYLGSKYYPELGYDGLYAASLAAQAALTPDGSQRGGSIRDLRTNELRSTRELIPQVREVAARFSAERWNSFVSDHRYFVESTPYGAMHRFRKDHGFNATPAWTSVARALTSKTSLSPVTSILVGCLDVLLLVSMFFLIRRTFGWRITCISLALCGLCFGWRYFYVGAFMRLDWLAAAVAGFCLLERGRPALAGAAIGYATAMRIFPVLLLAGPAILALKAFIRGERPRWPLSLAAGFAATLLLLIVAGGLTPRGFGAWIEFFHNIQLHQDLNPATRVGLDALIRSDPIALIQNLLSWDPQWPQPIIEEITAPRWFSHRVLQLAMLLFFGAAVWNASLSAAAVMGMVVIFTVTPVGMYYWILLLAMPLARGSTAWLGALLLSAALYAHGVAFPMLPTARLRFIALGWGLAAIFALWLLPAARRTIWRTDRTLV